MRVWFGTKANVNERWFPLSNTDITLLLHKEAIYNLQAIFLEKKNKKRKTNTTLFLWKIEKKNWNK